MKTPTNPKQKKNPQDGLASMKDVLLEFWKSMRSMKGWYFIMIFSFVVAPILGSVITPLRLPSYTSYMSFSV
jgi:hypothetical protein